MPSPGIDSLFDYQRLHNQDILKLFLYFPIGFILIILRLAVILVTWPLFAFLPKDSSLRSVLLKTVCLVFGIFVKKRDIHYLNERIRLLVCNHICIFDHLAVESVLSCKQVNICSHFFAEWEFPASDSERNFGHDVVPEDKINLLQHYINVSNATAALIFPERGTTNGKKGLLKFSPAPFEFTRSVQPVVIQIPRTSFIKIAPSVLGANDWCELLWLLFIPYTVYTLRVLPFLSKRERESTERFCKRIQDAMASKLNVSSTEYTSINKAELERNLSSLSSARFITSNPDTPTRIAARLNQMATQVKEVLPDVPFEVILRDIRLTRSIDDTIFRLIEGVVHYVPENNSSMHSPSTAASSSGKSANRTRVKAVLPLTAAAEKFGKTAGDRMQSYQERRAVFLRAAKMRYLQKHLDET